MERTPKSNQVVAFILALTGVVFFSAKAIFVKLAYNFEVDAISLLLLRLLFALPVYVVVLLSLFARKEKVQLKRNDLFKLILLGLVGYYLASLLDFAGLSFVSASLERLILFVYPTMVLIISSVFLRKRATIEQKIAVLITYFGVLLAFYKNTSATYSNLWVGVLLIFLSALSYAVYLVGCGNLIPRLGTKLFTSLVMIISTLASLIHFILTKGVDLFGFEPQVYWLALGMAVISTVIPSFLIAESIKRLGANNVAIIGSVGPISTIILAAIFLGERISVFQGMGTMVVISGILLLAKKKKEVKTQKVRAK